MTGAEAHGQGWVGPADLDNCADEPIHVPGLIQPHGFLVAASAATRRIAHASANLADWTGWEADEVIGARLDDVVEPALAAVAATALRDEWSQRYETEVAPGRTASAHLVDDLVVLEVEEHDGAEVPGSLTRDATMRLSTAISVEEAGDAVARAVRQATGFDRVMVYRFDRDWHGEVIAEAKAGFLNSFLGLHYPSTDIPAQARDLYRLNWLRLIVDVGYEPVGIVPAAAHDAARPLDLSKSVLRSVSPLHVEYLQNMGTTASLSISLIVDGDLWGLVACHHYSGPLAPSAQVRDAAEHIGRVASSRFAEIEAGERTRRAKDLGTIARRFAEAMAEAPHWAVEEALGDQEGDVLKLAEAAGAVVVDGDRRVALGASASDEAIDEILAAWDDRGAPLVTERAPGPACARDGVFGVLAVAITPEDGAVIWMRSEHVREVDWGGDPENAKLAASEGDSVRLSPRKSFERWREVVRGTSRPWLEAEVEAALSAARVIGGAYLRRERVLSTYAFDLQRALLPSSLPNLPGIAVDSFTAPDGQGIVGGDWYDAFLTSRGRLALVVGDIAGHGLDAAAAMAQFRNALRAYLVDEVSPARALDRMNGLARDLLPDEMATALVGLLDLSTLRLSLSAAGHPDPLLLRARGAEILPAGRNTVLGFQAREGTDHDTELRAGDTLVLFSDGLVESRVEAFDDRVAQLREVAVDELRQGADGLAGRLAQAMTQDERWDDVTVLTVTLLTGTPDDGPTG